MHVAVLLSWVLYIVINSGYDRTGLWLDLLHFTSVCNCQEVGWGCDILVCTNNFFQSHDRGHQSFIRDKNWTNRLCLVKLIDFHSRKYWTNGICQLKFLAFLLLWKRSGAEWQQCTVQHVTAPVMCVYTLPFFFISPFFKHMHVYSKEMRLRVVLNGKGNNVFLVTVQGWAF